MILVTGATGTSGREAVKALRALGAPVRCLVRDPAKAADLSAMGAGLARGDFSDSASLSAALEGCERALLIAPPDNQIERHEGAFIGAARGAGVKLVVKLSAVNADAASAGYFSRAHGRGEAALRASGLGFVILRPTFFMQNLLGSAGMIRERAIVVETTGSVKALVDVRDVGAAAARVLTGAGHEGETYTLTGPRALTTADVAAALSRALGRTISPVEVGFDEFRGALAGMGLPAWLCDAITDLQRMFANRAAAEVTDAVSRLTGSPATTLDQFIADHRGAFA
ncbi:MAG: SDR family oxidoreductase [Phycisphaerales bacterium]|nr:SDR family oxidoreductase [Phycisphaerales bacterium]